MHHTEDFSIVVTEGRYLFEEVRTPAAIPDRESQISAQEVAYWGTNNDYPQQILAELEKNSDLGSFLDLQARILYAGGVTYEVIDPQTGLAKPKRIPEIDRFLFNNWQYPMQAGVDFYRFINVFPELILTRDRKKIGRLVGRPANFCRYAKQNKKGLIPYLYIHSEWGTAQLRDEYMLKLPVINPLTDLPEELPDDRRGFNYAYPLSYPSGKVYYQLANWNALRNSKWLDLANKIPSFKLAVMTNQITLKYHIQIPDYYWTWKFPDWENMKPDVKAKKKTEEIEMITSFLKGEEKAGKSITTGYKIDISTQKELPGIKITALDDKIKDGVYLEDSVEATIKMFTAVGLDPSILGIVPGKGGSNRSGSDKREALNIYISIIQPHADIVLRPYHYISYYNGWNTDEQMINWRFRTPLLQTLDNVSPTKRETVLPETPKEDE